MEILTDLEKYWTLNSIKIVKIYLSKVFYGNVHVLPIAVKADISLGKKV